MTTPTTEDIQDLVSKAMRRAWQLGQTYWQQADSEYASYHKKADVTQAAFNTLVDETRAAIARPPEKGILRQFLDEAKAAGVTHMLSSPSADDLRAPKDGAEWKVVWWNESARLMLPTNRVLSSAKSYGNNTLMFTIKKRVYESQPTPKDPS